MMDGVGFFAALSRADLPPGQPLSKTPLLLFRDVLLIFIVAVALMLALMLWAKYLRNRKPKKRREEGQKVYRESSSTSTEERNSEHAEEAPAATRRKYKYRYRRRDHRQRNPTLAETGGLPPARSGPPESS